MALMKKAGSHCPQEKLEDLVGSISNEAVYLAEKGLFRQALLLMQEAHQLSITYGLIGMAADIKDNLERMAFQARSINPFNVDNWENYKTCRFGATPPSNDKPSTPPSSSGRIPGMTYSAQLDFVPAATIQPQTAKPDVIPCPHCGGKTFEIKSKGAYLVFFLLLLIVAIALPFRSLWWLFLSVPMGFMGLICVIGFSSKTMARCLSCGRLKWMTRQDSF